MADCKNRYDVYLQDEVFCTMVDEKYARRLFQFLLLGSRGGPSRIKIIHAIINSPLNTNQLAKEVGLDFKAVQHHLKVLTKNNMVVTMGEKYNVVYFPSPLLDESMDAFNDIVSRVKEK
jgi:DNA-binding transcriptional ArsR family regulator|uniref:Transcriptional regulator ArsR family n=1 Tax=uncultured marine thaumarchaeote KM3_66_E12 TaxID=1456229 RepID=A0A075HG68_9ARCH|nr:transcriptional regulator ArsR family [uncultured marine thaumarchaeote KM3_66_E12]